MNLNRLIVGFTLTILLLITLGCTDNEPQTQMCDVEFDGVIDLNINHEMVNSFKVNHVKLSIPCEQVQQYIGGN